jgi:hypothetical protein
MAARIHSRAMLNSFSRSSGLGACLAKFTQSRANSSNRQLISRKAFSRVRRSSPRSAPATIFQENLRELPAVPRLDHGLERHRRTRLTERPRAWLIDKCSSAASFKPLPQVLALNPEEVAISRAHNFFICHSGRSTSDRAKIRSVFPSAQPQLLKEAVRFVLNIADLNPRPRNSRRPRRLKALQSPVPRLRPYPKIAPARPAWRLLQKRRGPCHSLHSISVRKSNEFACLNAPFPADPGKGSRFVGRAGNGKVQLHAEH